MGRSALSIRGMPKRSLGLGASYSNRINSPKIVARVIDGNELKSETITKEAQSLECAGQGIHFLLHTTGPDMSAVATASVGDR